MTGASTRPPLSLPHGTTTGSVDRVWVASLSCCNFAAARVPRGGQSRRRSPPVKSSRRAPGISFARAPERLTLELGELDAVGGVGDVEVEDGPDEGEAAGLAGEAADDLGAAFDLAERSLEQVRAAPPPAVAGRVAQVDDERVEIVGQASGGGGVAGVVELVDEGLESL